MCVFLLKQAISYYITRGSPIFCVFLYASKAFDRVNYYLLFQKLIVRNVPMCFVRLLVYWYIQQSMQIRWGRYYSSLFSVTNGVSSGGYWVRRMRQSPQAPPFFGGPPSILGAPLENSIYSFGFAQWTIWSEDFFFFFFFWRTP